MGEVPPAVTLLAGAAVVAAAPRRAQGAVMLAVSVLALAHVLALDPGASATLPFFGYEAEMLRVDQLSRAFGVVFALAAALASLYGLRVMSTGERAAALVYAGAGVGVVFAGDLLTLFVFWEIKALASTCVVWAGRRPDSRRAASRYLYVHLTGGTLLLAGILRHLAAGGGLDFAGFETGEPGAWLILAGFLLSAAAPPLHAWLPDAYPQGSAAGTVFLSAFTTKAAVYALARGFPGTELLVWVGVVMALWGTVYALLEDDTRRLLGYSIIAQVGYMVAAVGVGGPEGVNGATAHAFAHILYKALLLMGAGALLHATGRTRLSELGGLARQMPLVLGLYLVGAASIAGVPLFSGFVTKELAVEAVSAAGHGVVVDLLKVATVGTFLHTALKLPYFAWFGSPRGEPRAVRRAGPVPPSMLVAMALAAAVNVVIGVAPQTLYGLLPSAVHYAPYTASHLSQSLQLLGLAALAFWALAPRLRGEPTRTLEVDWLYRALPAHVGAAGQAAAGRVPLERGRTAVTGAARAAAAGAARTAADLARVAPAPDGGQDARAWLVPTWVLGTVALIAFVGLLALGFLV